MYIGLPAVSYSAFNETPAALGRQRGPLLTFPPWDTCFGTVPFWFFFASETKGDKKTKGGLLLQDNHDSESENLSLCVCSFLPRTGIGGAKRRWRERGREKGLETERQGVERRAKEKPTTMPSDPGVEGLN